MLTLARAALSKMHRDENSLVTRAYEISEQEAGRLPSGFWVSYMLLLAKVTHVADHADWWASAACERRSWTGAISNQVDGDPRSYVW